MATMVEAEAVITALDALLPRLGKIKASEVTETFKSLVSDYRADGDLDQCIQQCAALLLEIGSTIGHIQRVVESPASKGALLTHWRSIFGSG